jgi:light-regulated signal transduction histidine kinase (bacteriophytochrome)
MDSPADPRWPKILSLSVHEFRTPLTVVAGYVRMLLKDRAGALTDQQRKLLTETEKSCARLSALVAEMSELSSLEGGTATFNKQPTDLHAALRAAIDQLPPLPDREVAVDLDGADGAVTVDGDPVRLAQALGSVIAAIRREVVGSDRLLVRARDADGGREILVGEPAVIDAMEAEPAGGRALFDEWRGGVGLSLLNARRMLNAHGAGLFAPPDRLKAGVRILFAKP